MSYRWYDVVGNVGVLLVLSTYLWLQLGRLRYDSLTYSVANAAGAFGILVSLVYEFNLSAFLIEGAWLLISLYGIARCFLGQAAAGR